MENIPAEIIRALHIVASFGATDNWNKIKIELCYLLEPKFDHLLKIKEIEIRLMELYEKITEIKPIKRPPAFILENRRVFYNKKQREKDKKRRKDRLERKIRKNERAMLKAIEVKV